LLRWAGAAKPRLWVEDLLAALALARWRKETWVPDAVDPQTRGCWVAGAAGL